MATIRTSCPDCTAKLPDQEKVKGRQVESEFSTNMARVCITSEDGFGLYMFICPRCSSKIVKAATPKDIDLMIASGVELTKGLQMSEVAALDESDLKRFGDLLRATSAREFERELAQIRS